jgi:hypothetical protein
MEPKVEH